MSDTASKKPTKAEQAEADRTAKQEALVDAAHQHVKDELAKQPYRAEPSWDDLHAAIRSVLRFIFHEGNPPPDPAPAVPPVGTDDDRPDQTQTATT